MLDIQIRTTKETKEMLREFPDETRDALFAAMNDKVAPFLERTVKKSFGRSGYPGVRSGHLRRSIYNKAIERATTVIGIVGTEVIYGRFLEDGTRKMKARPFLRPAVEDNLVKISRVISDHISGVLNK